MTSYVYLHGFASSPASSKAQYFKTRLAEHGIDLAVPALDGGDFEHLTLSKQLARIDQQVQGGTVVLLGSSMGGYLAALYAARHSNVERLVLLAPAFDFQARWVQLQGEAAIHRWKQTRELRVFHYGSGIERRLGYELFEDAARYPGYPFVTQPTLILHGQNDEIVPPVYSREFLARNPKATLQLFESGHELTNVLPELWNAAAQFLFEH